MTGDRPKQIYKITYPNGRIYIGMDLTGDPFYLGSPSASRQIAADLKLDTSTIPCKALALHCPVITGEMIHLRNLGLLLRKEILWESVTAADSEVRDREIRYIREHRANDPTIGYNKVPRLC